MTGNTSKVTPSQAGKLYRLIAAECQKTGRTDLVEEAHALALKLIERGRVSVRKNHIRNGCGGIVLDLGVAHIVGNTLKLNPEGLQALLAQ